MKRKTKKNRIPQESGKIEYTRSVYRFVVPELDDGGRDTGRLWWGDLTEKGIPCFQVSTKVDYKLLDVAQDERLCLVIPKLYELKNFVLSLCAMYEVPKILMIEPDKAKADVLFGLRLDHLEDWIVHLNGSVVLTLGNVGSISTEFNPSAQIAEFFETLKR
jgi:hypothetical protein